MSTATEIASFPVTVDPELSKAILNSVNGALLMCDTKAECVGVSSVPTRDSGNLTGMIGVHGKVSGFIAVNMAERMAIRAVGGLLQEEFSELNSQVVDGTGEIANIIVGGIKSALSKTPWAFLQITVPSVIVGKGYQIAYARGLEFINMVFEHEDPEAIMFQDRLMNVSMSLLRL